MSSSVTFSFFQYLKMSPSFRLRSLVLHSTKTYCTAFVFITYSTIALIYVFNFIFIIQVSIPSAFQCDMIINCDDAEDELGCSTATRFYCEDGVPLFVSIDKVKLFNDK